MLVTSVAMITFNERRSFEVIVNERTSLSASVCPVRRKYTPTKTHVDIYLILVRFTSHFHRLSVSAMRSLISGFSSLWSRFSIQPTYGASRKYVDLIYRQTSWYATYRPFQGNKIEVRAYHSSCRDRFRGSVSQVGDYGELDKETGDFVYRGNIYKDTNVLACVPELKTDASKPVTGEPIDAWIVSAEAAQKSDASLGPDV